jgi:hypothetical protein
MLRSDAWPPTTGCEGQPRPVSRTLHETLAKRRSAVGECVAHPSANKRDETNGATIPGRRGWWADYDCVHADRPRRWTAREILAQEQHCARLERKLLASIAQCPHSLVVHTSDPAGPLWWFCFCSLASNCLAVPRAHPYIREHSVEGRPYINNCALGNAEGPMATDSFSHCPSLAVLRLMQPSQWRQQLQSASAEAASPHCSNPLAAAANGGYGAEQEKRGRGGLTRRRDEVQG